jgi:transcriptional regulator with XRE-family HTH domain
MTLAEEIGGRLRARRNAARQTLREVAGRAGLSVSFLCEIERGRTLPGAGAIRSLCRALSMTADELLGTRVRNCSHVWSCLRCGAARDGRREA